MAASLRRRLVAGGSWVFAGKIVTATTNLLVGSLLARLLTTEEFRDYGLAFSVVTAGSMIALLGLQHAIVRLVAESLGLERPGRARAAVRLAFRWVSLGIVLASAFLWLGGWAWLAQDVWRSRALAGALAAITVWLGVSGLQVLTSETFRGFKDLRLASTFGGVITGVLFAAVLAGLLAFGRPVTLERAIWVGAGAGAVSVACALVVLGRTLARLPRAEPIAAREVLSISMPMWGSGVAAFVLGQSALWIIGAYLPEAEGALYFAALRVVTLVSTPLILVNLVVPPFVAELYAAGQLERLQRVLRATATLAGIPGFAVLIVFVLFGAFVLQQVYTPAYREAAPVLAWLSLGYLVNVWTGSCGVTLAMTGHQSTLMSSTVVSGLLSVAGTFLVVQRFGITGVAVVVCAMVVLQNVWQWLAARYHTGLWTHATIPSVRDVRDLFKG